LTRLSSHVVAAIKVFCHTFFQKSMKSFDF